MRFRKLCHISLHIEYNPLIQYVSKWFLIDITALTFAQPWYIQTRQGYFSSRQMFPFRHDCQFRLPATVAAQRQGGFSLDSRKLPSENPTSVRSFQGSYTVWFSSWVGRLYDRQHFQWQASRMLAASREVCHSARFTIWPKQILFRITPRLLCSSLLSSVNEKVLSHPSPILSFYMMTLELRSGISEVHCWSNMNLVNLIFTPHRILNVFSRTCWRE